MTKSEHASLGARWRRGFAALAFTLLPVSAIAQNVQAGPTLSAVRARNQLVCGAHPGVAGFGAPDSQGNYRGFDPDICRAITAAVLGEAIRIRFVPLTSQARIPALQSGEVDIVVRTFTWTMSREAGAGFLTEALAHLVVRLGGALLVDQASLLDSLGLQTTPPGCWASWTANCWRRA